MKKTCFLCLALILFASFCPMAFGAERTPLNVYNWGEYIDNTVIKEFEKENPDIKVNYTTFDSNEAMYSKIVSGAASYDVVIPSDYMVSKMINEDLLLPLDFSLIPNYKNIGTPYKNLIYDRENRYSVPYTWGTVVIIYNSEFVDEKDVADRSAELLWNKKYTGKILMFDNPRDAFGIALKTLGYSMNSSKKEEWEAAARKLGMQKPLVQAYVMDAIFDKLESQEAWIAPYYAGDALTISERNDKIRFYVPKEGTNMFVDAMCVLKTTRHKNEAMRFINFMCSAQTAAKNAEAIGYATPNIGALKLLDKEITENEQIYPSERYLKENTEIFMELPKDMQNLQSVLWTNLKIVPDENGGINLTWIDVTCIALVFAMTIYGIYRAVDMRKKRRLWKTDVKKVEKPKI